MRKITAVGLTVFLFSGVFWILTTTVLGQAPDNDKVNVNQAEQAWFYTLPGMTETLAKAIVEYREKVGRFGTLSDLLKVPGMTKEYLDRISSRIVILPEDDDIKLPHY
ncbi:MAG TPA: helix-hairpin-helix domain-containing protein [Syntrophorhabdales bacterium]|nr:helix-hairpin-helix domain-containing protein [Syntrophorhabdales bacterium]